MSAEANNADDAETRRRPSSPPRGGGSKKPWEMLIPRNNPFLSDGERTGGEGDGASGTDADSEWSDEAPALSEQVAAALSAASRPPALDSTAPISVGH